MIDVSTLGTPSDTTVVPSSDSIFNELGNNTYDFTDLVSELIDNSLAARLPQGVKIELEIHVDEHGTPKEFVIRDNGSGIPQEKLGLAIAPAGMQSKGSLNEHGLGMKQAVAALGELKYLATRTPGEADARVILKFKYGSLDVYHAPFASDSGTEICVKNLKPAVITDQTKIRSLTRYLGARYRRFLKPERKVMDLKLDIINPYRFRLDDSESNNVERTWTIEEVRPVYFHPSTRRNEPVISRMELSGPGWKAKLTFGYAPDKDKGEFEELGLDPVPRTDPYYVSLRKQGLDIIMNDRVIKFHQLSEIAIVNERHNSFNSVRGEIDLLSGFSTAITKNSIVDDANFRDCITKVRDILWGDAPDDKGKKRKYLKSPSYPEQIPESLYRDRMRRWLVSNTIAKRERADKEYVVEGIEGFIDIRAIKDGEVEAWEIKTVQADAKDVYQLYMYMDIAEIDKGYFLAPGFSPGAEIAKNHIQTNHKKTIEFTRLDEYPINDSPTQEELQEYY
jgi:hypothetical protein